jgi:hypothetical protein
VTHRPESLPARRVMRKALRLQTQVSQSYAERVDTARALLVVGERSCGSGTESLSRLAPPLGQQAITTHVVLDRIAEISKPGNAPERDDRAKSRVSNQIGESRSQFVKSMPVTVAKRLEDFVSDRSS